MYVMEIKVGITHTYLQLALQTLDVFNGKVQHVRRARLLLMRTYVFLWLTVFDLFRGWTYLASSSCMLHARARR
jgi:hypothetical protein